jgi:hypothetical protein
MRYIFFFILLIPSFVLAQSAGKDKKTDSKTGAKATKETVKTQSKTEAKVNKEAVKAETKIAKEATKADAKATKESAKTDPKPTQSAGVTGVWVCGSSDVWHINKDCSALKNCKQTVTEGQSKAERQCKICAKSNK